MNFDALYPRDDNRESVYSVNEIPSGSMLKIEWNRKSGAFELDRVEPGIFAKPVNYGFIPGTLDEDGDALDTLVVCDEPLPTGVVVRLKVVAVLNYDDGGEMDHKIVGVPEDDRHWGNTIAELDDIAAAWKAQIEHHFTHYKDLKKPGTTRVLGWGTAEDAWKIIDECTQRFNKQ